MSGRRKIHLPGGPEHTLCGQPLVSRQWARPLDVNVRRANCHTCMQHQTEQLAAKPKVENRRAFTLPRRDVKAPRLRGHSVSKTYPNGDLHVIWLAPGHRAPEGYV